MELALAALLRGPSEQLLEAGMAPAVNQLMAEAEKLEKRYKRDVPLPPPTALRTIESPAMEEPLQTLMEVLSPEFPTFLTGTPFTLPLARASVAVDRSPEALEDVAHIMDLFQRHAAEAHRNATEIAVKRRFEIKKRHMLELEQMFVVEGAAAVLEAARINSVNGTTKEERQAEWKRRNDIRRKQRSSCLSGVKMMQSKELAFYDMATRVVLDHLDAKMAAQSDMLRQSVESVNWVINSMEPARNDSVECLLQANKFLAEAYDFNEEEASFYTTVAALCGSMATAVEQSMRMLMSSVLEFEEPVEGSTTGLSAMATIALTNLKELHKKAEKFLKELVRESPVMKRCKEILKPSTTTEPKTTTTEPAIHYDDRSPAWLRRKAFIKRVKRLQELRKKRQAEKEKKAKEAAAAAAAAAKNGTTPLSGGAPKSLLHHIIHRVKHHFKSKIGRVKKVVDKVAGLFKKKRRRGGSPEQGKWERRTIFTVTGADGKASTFGARVSTTTPFPTEEPTDPVAREQVLALARRLKAFAQGLAEYDQARVAFAGGHINEGEQALANTYDDLKTFSKKTPPDELEHKDDETDPPEIGQVRQLLAARIANVEAHLQVSAYLRNEGTDGVNFFGKASDIHKDVEEHIDSVSANMENVITHFKLPEDVMEGSDAVGLLIGGSLGSTLRAVRKEVLQLTKNTTKTEDGALEVAANEIHQGHAALKQMREEFRSDVKLAEGKYRWHNVSDDLIDKIH